MKKLLHLNSSNILFMLLLFNIIQVKAQAKKDSCCISEKDLIGIWQRDSKLVGSGLNQNFQFFADKTFVLNLGSAGDDVRSLNKLKGKYRLNKDKIFFTITSRTIVEGKIGIDDPGISLSIFYFEDGMEKEIPESNPKEIEDPCYITLVSKKHIKLNNEVYYKVKL